MKKFIFLSLFLTMFSCEDIINQAIENAIEEKENENTLFISIKNNTQFTFENPKIIINDYTYVFQDVYANTFSEGNVFAYAYSEAKITTKINGELFVFIPLTLQESSLVTKGNFYYEVSVQDYNQKRLTINRIKF